MHEYIERKAAIKDVMAAKWKDGADGAMAMQIVATVPAADVAPVVHGRYISTGYDEWYCDSGKCSNCGGDMLSGSKFCPNCGAKMKLEESSCT